MTREMQHVIGIGLERAADDDRVAHFEDANLAVLVALRRFDGVENVLQLPLLVEHGSAA